jgi:hypothetical protein
VPAADKEPRPLALALEACTAGQIIKAIGHAAKAPGGGAIALSHDRVTAVLDRLHVLGAPRQVIGADTGLGNTTNQPVDNTYNENFAHLSRIVELTIDTQP